MWPVSDEFLTALRYSHDVVVRCDILVEGEVVRTLPITAGSVEVDASAASRRHSTLSLVDLTGELTPVAAGDLLTPFGNEVRPWRGVILPDGSEELIPLATLRIARFRAAERGEQFQIDLTGYDRSRAVRRNRFVEEYVVASGTNYGTAIQDLIRSRLPGITFSPEDFSTFTTRSTPRLVFDVADDPWKATLDMAESIGAEVLFDQMGTCVLRAVPDPDQDPVVATYAEGDEATLLGAERKMDDEGVYNGVVATGESTNVAAPVRAEVWDENEASPTYRFGPFGEVPRFYSSSMLTSDEQAEDAAQGILRKALGSSEDVMFDSLVNPAHDSGDIIKLEAERVKVDARYVLDSFSLPLTVEDAMPATTRRRAT